MLKNKRNIYYFCALTGAAVFVLIYGILPLNPSYDAWIFNNYIETDIVQRYAGWLAYRNADSFFPLTFSSLINFPFGDYTSLADSIPAAEILFKLLSPFLPTVFQFCGILCFLCLVLQGFCGAALVGLFTSSKWQIYFGGVLFCLSPVLIERLFRHTSLSFHWLLLLAIYLYFKGKRSPSIKITIAFVALTVFSVFIHLYFTPMLAGFFLAYILDAYKLKKAALPHLALLVGALGLCFLSAGMLGILNLGTQNTSGYGSMGMNLNALFNPVSLDSNWWVEGMGKLKWSAFLPVRALAHNNLEGFNYLGLGVLLSLLVLCAVIVYRLCKAKKAAATALAALLKGNLFLLLFLGLSTAFAITNTVCAFSYVVLQIPLPNFLLSFFNIFRASGRLFWSVNYMLVLCGFLTVCKLFSRKKLLNRAIVVALIAVQLIDLSPALMQKQQRFTQYEGFYNQARLDQLLAIAQNTNAVYYLELMDARHICAALLKNGIASNLWLISRDGYNTEASLAEMQRVLAELLQGRSPYESTIYATKSKETAESIKAASPQLEIYEIDSIFYLKN